VATATGAETEDTEISVSAINGGTANTAAEGLYTESAAEFLGMELSQYYGLPDLFFGDSSEDCSHLREGARSLRPLAANG